VRAKHAKFAELGRLEGAPFVAAVMETFGHVAEELESFVSLLSVTGGGRLWQCASAKAHCFTSLSFCLQRANAFCLARAREVLGMR